MKGDTTVVTKAYFKLMMTEFDATTLSKLKLSQDTDTESLETVKFLDLIMLIKGRAQ